MNTLSIVEQHLIWVPELIFANTEKREPTLNDEATFINIRKTGGYSRSRHDVLDNIYIYKGSENAITSSRIYNTQFICDYYLAYFPFDTQKCTMVFRLKGNLGTFIDLDPG